jgi:hypothetical protein
MLTTWYGKEIERWYSADNNVYTANTKTQLIAAMDVWSTLPIWQYMSNNDILPDSGPILITTWCTVQWKDTTSWTHQIDLTHLTDHATLDTKYDNKQRPRFRVTYEGDNAITMFEYVLVDAILKDKTPPQSDLSWYHKISNTPIQDSHLNHYGQWIAHGSWIIQSLLDQIEQQIDWLKHTNKRQIWFVHPWTRWLTTHIYNHPENNSYMFNAVGNDIYEHTLATAILLND